MNSEELVKLEKLIEIAESQTEPMPNFEESEIVLQIFKCAEKKDEKSFFKVKILDSQIEYKDKEMVRDIMINGIELYSSDNHDCERHTFLPINFVEDLKKNGVTEFALTGEVPVKLIAELRDMGCEFKGLYSNPLSDFSAESGLDPVLKGIGSLLSQLEESQNLTALKKEFDSKFASKLQTEPRLLFTISNLSVDDDSEE